MALKYLTKQNNFRVANLFLETANRDESTWDEGSTPVFTLSPSDITGRYGHVFKAISRRFIEIGDITGYKFAMEVFGSYEQYLLLCAHKVIGKAIDDWKTELKARLDSFAIDSIEKIIKDGGSQVQLSAAKYLANREYEVSGSVGRPSNSNKSRKADAEAIAMDRDTAAELERLNLTH